MFRLASKSVWTQCDYRSISGKVIKGKNVHYLDEFKAQYDRQAAEIDSEIAALLAKKKYVVEELFIAFNP